MRGRIILCLIFGLVGCEKPLELPPLLRDQGARVGNSWLLCSSPLKQHPEDAVHHEGIVANLKRQFPPGSPGNRLDAELIRQGFKVRQCETDPTVRIATYRWTEHWGGQGLIAFKADRDGKIEWATGFNSYGGP